MMAINNAWALNFKFTQTHCNFAGPIKLESTDFSVNPRTCNFQLRKRARGQACDGWRCCPWFRGLSGSWTVACGRSTSWCYWRWCRGRNLSPGRRRWHRARPRKKNGRWRCFRRLRQCWKLDDSPIASMMVKTKLLNGTKNYATRKTNMIVKWFVITNFKFCVWTRMIHLKIKLRIK